MAVVGRILQFARYYSSFYDDTLHTAYPQNENLANYVYEGAGAYYLMFASPDYNVGATTPIYRLYSPTLGDHWHTPMSSASGYYSEGVVGYVYNRSGPYSRAMYSFVIYRNGKTNHYNSFQSSPFPGYTSLGLAYYAPLIVYGCTDPSADNYNVYANQNSTGCTYSIRGCTDPLASNYNPNANVNQGCSYPTPVISMSLSQNSIIQGGSSTLSWTIFNSTSRSLSGVGSIAANGSLQVSPADDTTYTITANYYGYTSSTASKTLVVYVPPVATLTVDDTTIVQGENTILRWSTTGDASTASISPGIGSTNLTSFQSISPSQTTTYTLSVSGNGGSDSSQVTVTVLQPPTATIGTPLSVNYGDTITISYSQENATTAFELRVFTNDLDGNSANEVIDLGAGESANGTYTYTPTYTNRGPLTIDFTLAAIGQGNLAGYDYAAVPVIIDQLPDAIDIPETDDAIKDETPVITPDIEVTTTQIVVNDIDVPVAIKADYPIQVEIDNSGIYRDVEQI